MENENLNIEETDNSDLGAVSTRYPSEDINDIEIALKVLKRVYKMERKTHWSFRQCDVSDSTNLG